MTRLCPFLLLAVALAAGCGDDNAPSTVDGGRDAGETPVDAATPIDSGLFPDAGGDDAGELPIDGGTPDAGSFEDAGSDAGIDPLGTIAGSCGVLDDLELLGAEPFYFENRFDFPMGFSDPDDRSLLSEGAQELLSDGTAGGSSGLSEAISFEVLHRCEGAVLIKSEIEIVYDPPTSVKTDILVAIDGHRIGVSVTRAVGFPRDVPYTVDRARTLLEDKLADILVSSANVVEDDAWEKQILFVVAYADMHADSIMSAWELVDTTLRADTILWVMVSDGDDAFLY